MDQNSTFQSVLIKGFYAVVLTSSMEENSFLVWSVLAAGILSALSCLAMYFYCSSGVMDFCFSVNPVVELVAAGLFSMLRSCLDEREESVVFAATQCLANLIAPQVL